VLLVCLTFIFLQVWVDGVQSTIHVPEGFCWTGRVVSLTDTVLQNVFLPDHGFATVAVVCEVTPYYLQCTVDPSTVIVLVTFVASFAVLFLLSTGVYLLVFPASATELVTVDQARLEKGAANASKPAGGGGDKGLGLIEVVVGKANSLDWAMETSPIRFKTVKL